ncbi:MAG: T9SS type A sorting domain-containing protein [Lentimicrobium sp.]|nr:T9SS type A sorting domain-containing protein [Lentimicrobium sp.]
MKKLLLIASAVCIGFGLYAQKSPAKVKINAPVSTLQNYNVVESELIQSPSVVTTYPESSFRGTSEVSVINIGGAGNAYGLYNGGRTALWADPNLNTVAFFHRMLIPPGSGYISYDLSVDGGNTWTVNNQLYDPSIAPGANARYPQGVILNPTGNTTPTNAFGVSVNPILDGSNGTSGSWGGLGTASIKLDGTGVTQESWPTTPPFRNNVPDAMALNPVTGDVFVVEGSLIGGLGNQYVDTLIITRGVWNGTAMDYTQSLLFAPVLSFGTSIADSKIAFAPDGMIGYILTLSDNGQDPFLAGSAFYPILYKTEDGGVTWDENPITVITSGPDGLPGIVYGLMDDDQWLEFWGDPVPDRDEIAYTTAFFADFAVDMFGNPVINVVIGVSGIHSSNGTPYSILSAGGFIASYNIFSQDGGQTWLAQKLGNNLKTFRGTWGTDPNDITEDNRSQLTTTYDGSKMFFSWLDTDFDAQEDNQQPDIFCVGWDIETNSYTDIVNVTFLSDAWLAAYMATASFYAFESGSDYIIPFVYQQMAVEGGAINPLGPVQYKYIPDFKFNEDDFGVWIGVNEPAKTVAGISQNYPNPFNGTTRVEVTLSKAANVSLEVYNIVGQKVYEIPARNLGEGTHQFQINASGLKAGIYTYSVIADGERNTRKMMVK